ncbi:MAG: transglutaminase family protein [bacterium JZ-2024 1]
MGIRRSRHQLTSYRTAFVDDLLILGTGACSLVLFSLSDIVPDIHLLFAGVIFGVALFLRHKIPDRLYGIIRIITESLFSILLLVYLYLLAFYPDNFFPGSIYLISSFMSVYAIRIFSHYETAYFLSFPLASILLTGSTLPITHSFIPITLVALLSLLLLFRTDWSYFASLPRPMVRHPDSLFSTRLLLPIQFGVIFLSLVIYLNLESLPVLPSPFRLRAPRPDAIGEGVRVTVATSISPRFVSYSGFSVTLRLASPESIHLSERPVLRVRAPFAGYWRVVVFSRYTGRNFQIQSDFPLASLEFVELTRDFQVPHDPNLREESVYFSRIITQYEFLANFTNVLPTLYMPHRVSLTSVSSVSPQSYGILSDDALSLRLAYLPKRGFSYSVLSLVPNTHLPYSTFVPSTGDTVEKVPDEYLAIPPSVPDRVRTLARSLTEEDITPLQKLRTLIAYLSDTTRFSYSLDLPEIPAGHDAVDFFLFESRKGYCELYAAALAVLLRSINIPSRVVGGFLGGEYDLVTSSIVVRDRDAHAWVEAFVPPWGWINADATPEAPNTLSSAPSEDLGESVTDPSSPLASRMFRSRLFYLLSVALSLWNSFTRALATSSKSLGLPALATSLLLLFLWRRRLAIIVRWAKHKFASRPSPVLRLIHLIESRSRIKRRPAESLRAYFERLVSKFPRVASQLLSLRDDLEAFLYGPQNSVLMPSHLMLRARSLRFDKSGQSVVKET